MVTCTLMGGLGNYMFQIATTYNIALKNNDEMFFRMSDCHQVHKNIRTYTDNIFKKINFIDDNNIKIDNVFIEKEFNYSPIEYNKNLRIYGYFQSDKYFNKNSEKVKLLFGVDENSKKIIFDKYGEILKRQTCSIHVRRGDYIRLSEYHNILDIQYYTDAINLFDKQTLFLVFSDDIEWCKENFIGDNFMFIDGNLDYIDLWLMSMCDNNIIANSTFSWWGAFLNNNKSKKVIAPKVWFGNANKHLIIDDLYPESWIIL